jgi:hypothetical protein
MAGRRPNESTRDWLERLIGEGATDAQINGVRAILESEGAICDIYLFPRSFFFKRNLLNHH